MVSRTVLQLMAVNAVTVAMLYSRFAGTEYGQKVHAHIKATLASTVPPSLSWIVGGQSHVCGSLPWRDYTIMGQRVVLPDGTVQPASIRVVAGLIVGVSLNTSAPSLTPNRTLDFKDAVIMPGVIDVHAHLNEPGREHWEGITTGTTAAAVGGVTTVMDMPLNSNPVTTTVEQLKAKQRLAASKAMVNVGYWAGLVPNNARDHTTLKALLLKGAAGFKCFMCPSGIQDFDHVTGMDIAAALPFLKAAGVPLFVHAEVVDSQPEPQGDARDYTTYMHTRPPSMEQAAIQLLIQLLDNDTSRATPGFSVHIAHLADAGSLPLIQAAKARHPITVETCAHYLTFSSGQVKQGQTWFKCAPPLRGPDNQAALIEGVVSGGIQLVSSDHSPAPPDMKQLDTGDFLKAWGGISGLQYLLPATWTALKGQGVSLGKLSQLLTWEPARLAGLSKRKGKLALGYDADIVVWKPEELADTSTEGNEHRHKVSPYTDVALQGKVVATIVQGSFVNLFGKLSGPCGTPVGGGKRQ